MLNKIGYNKTADEESCKVGTTGGAPLLPKSEAGPKLKQLLGLCE
jgi:hypothetical protein